MKNTVTVTSKGQTTIPSIYRRQLGLSRHGGKLDIRFDEARGELIIAKPLNIDELSIKLSSYIKANTVPLEDVDQFYQQHRDIK